MIDPTPSQPVAELSYEQALAELENILFGLENEDHPLEAAIALYERGQELAQHCAALLDNAALRVQKLTAEGLETLER